MGQNSFIAPSTPLDRRHLGKYEVLCRLSTGGMSAIYLAHQTGLGGFKKLVVLKTILPDIDGEEDFVGMFLEEARITAVFNHPNIAQVFELETDEGQLFMAMEFVQGCTLVEMARACRQAKESIPVGFTLASTRDTALALHYAHTFTDARGRKQIVIHRDVAEKNIMVTYEGVTKLLDFGIAKALGRRGRTGIGMVKGTSGYMSPEQIRGEPLDPRSDIFALGVVMHECLTGMRLFHGKTAEEGMMAALREEVQPPSKLNKEVSPDLDAVVLKALQRDRENRFNTALEFARAIEKAAPGLIWHPEQLGELVTKRFSERRAETRRLLESSEFGAENTVELRLENVLAQVRANAATAGVSAVEPRKPPVTAPPRPVTARDGETRAGVLPSELKNPPLLMPQPAPSVPPPPPFSVQPQPPPQVSTQQTKALRGPTTVPSGVSAASPSFPRPQSQYEDDDDGADKTIPATELPEEIRNLRAQFSASRKPASDKSPALPVNEGRKPASDKSPALPVNEGRKPASDKSPALLVNEGRKPASDKSPALPVNDGVVTSRDRPVLVTPPQPRQEVKTAETSLAPASLARGPRTGETVSSAKKNDVMDWDEDDDEVKTAVAKAGELPGLAALRNGPPVLSEEFAEPAGTEIPAEVSARPRKFGLFIVLSVLAILVVGGVLMLLDVLPMPQLP